LPEQSVTLILGGARSGKSRHAEDLVSSLPAPWTYLATAEAYDDEIRERIAKHQARRDDRWHTICAPHDLVEALEDLTGPVLLDCLTLWLSNLMLAEHDIEVETGKLVDRLKRPTGNWFVVSNEVGSGIVPENALARRFRDAQGRLNQQVAAIADHVILVVAGIPMQVK
jgi:adenosylcobinamide kinase / adenosylcobinamide-phosphate guanylyltransferase